jgi:hypothetical protein
MRCRGWADSSSHRRFSSQPSVSYPWQQSLPWNPDVSAPDTSKAAEQHVLVHSTGQHSEFRHVELTLRYTACGGLVNQHYCHLAALALAHLANVSHVIWPPMQERQSFNLRYHSEAHKNEQSWTYLDATTVWDLEAVQANMIGAHHVSSQ